MNRFWRQLRRLFRSDTDDDDDLDAYVNSPEFGEFMNMMTEAQTPQQSSRLSLAQYVDLISEVPLPTPEQRDNFVEFVAHAHSWYKHLPVGPPGAPFYFFIDKYASYERVIDADRKRTFRTRSEQGFHYSDIPTKEHLSRFGHLSYSTGSGTTVMPVELPMVLPRDPEAAVPGDDGKMHGLPSEIESGGLTHLTAVVHSRSATIAIRIGERYWQGLTWPEESGGQATLQKLIDRTRLVKASPYDQREKMGDLNPELLHTSLNAYQADPVLYELLSPERTRQYEEMRNAIDRVCEVIESQRELTARQE